MQKPIFSFLAITILFSCKARIDDSNTNSRAYQTSKTYKEYLSGYDNKIERIQADKDFFSLIGEEGFLNLNKGQFYVIYLYEASRDTLTHYYIIKSENGVEIASHKTENRNEYVLENEAFHTFKASVESFKIDNSTIIPIKEVLNNASKKVKKVFPSNYDNPLRVAFYFDGQDYHRLSAFQLEESDLNVLDSTIRNFKPFIAGRQ